MPTGLTRCAARAAAARRCVAAHRREQAGGANSLVAQVGSRQSAGPQTRLVQGVWNPSGNLASSHIISVAPTAPRPLTRCLSWSMHAAFGGEHPGDHTPTDSTGGL